MTNYETIKNMTIDELAKFLMSFDWNINNGNDPENDCECFNKIINESKGVKKVEDYNHYILRLMEES